MFASAQIGVGKSDKVLTVPTSAVIDSGTRQVVLVRLAEGRFEPRAVTLGSRSDDYVEVLAGVAEGEAVVTSANFLIDAESNLKAALGGMNSQENTSPPVGAATSTSSGQASAANANRQQAGSYKAKLGRHIRHRASSKPSTPTAR